MKLSERSYSTKSVRPRPTIYAEPDGSLLIITTSWGETDLAAKVNEDIAKYVQAAVADVEVTSPFEFMTCFSDEANYLRVALLISNESVYRAENRGEYVGGVETLILFQRNNKLAYAQVGSPNLLIQKRGMGLAPVSVSYEASHELSSTFEIYPPLPQDLLGVDPSLNIRCGDLRIDEKDRLLVYSGGFWPHSMWSATEDGDDLHKVTQKIVQTSPDAPFWLGLVSL
ncbi:MAG: hypothetical protein H7326_07345 [Bdellovibrionaceae bacterium]|nr:hypothetical protein [Pseudobdellovibrionaceae bacterium]